MSIGQADTARVPGPDAHAMMMFESRKKSVVIAYLFWLFLNAFGAHRFYAGKNRSALAMLVLGVAGWVTVVLYLSPLLLGLVGLWALVDLVLIPGMIRDYNSGLASELGGGSAWGAPRSTIGDDADPNAGAQADALIARYLARDLDKGATPKRQEERPTVKTFGTRARAP